jgi:uncharacterized repeat protein (TIGR02543 family)
MKKLFLLIACLSLLLLLCACGGNTDDTETYYNVKWFDENGVEIATVSLKEGTVPQRTYIVSDTAEWNYSFDGWSETAGGEPISSLPALSSNVSYYAVVSRVKQSYTVSFNTQGGSSVSAQTVEYGQKAIEPEKPSRDGYKFIGWSVSKTGDESVDFDAEITGNVEYFAIWNKVIDVKGLLKSLLDSYKRNPMDYLPESMRYDYSQNLIDPNDIPVSYTSFVSVSDIPYGFGEQWNMILGNILESQNFFTVLNTVENISTATVTVFNNYFDKNPADTAHHEFKYGSYDVTINFDGNDIYYVLDFTLAGQSVQISLSMNSETLEKTVRVQLGDANALLYRIGENSYEFAIKYLGVRRAIISLERDSNGNVTGKIYEYTGVDAAMISSAAEFYITDDYVSVIGNKANGMIGFTGYIAELYDVESGKMLAYEVKETLSSINYDTLWFNLSDIDGIQSIKKTESTDSEASKIFVNGGSSEWNAKKNLLSRRFDIEFRTQYVYSYDRDTETYTKHTVSVPMLFVQENNYDTLVADVKSTNEIDIRVSISAADFTMLLSEYDSKIPVFIENKDKIDAEYIIDYIGDKRTFKENNQS